MDNPLKNDPRYLNHESRPDLAGEHPQGDRLQLAAFIMFVIAFLVDHFFIGWAASIRSYIPFWYRCAVSVIFIFTGLFLSISGIQFVFSDYTEEPRMLTSRYFTWVRHPIYLGALLVYVGLLIFILSPLALFAFFGVGMLYDWLARDEEARMLDTFGARYEEYKCQTPRWFPALFKNKHK